jgi:hypothetical protein
MAFTAVYHKDGAWVKESAPDFKSALAKFDSWGWKYAGVIAQGTAVAFAYAGKEDMHQQAANQIDAKCGNEHDIQDNHGMRTD